MIIYGAIDAAQSAGGDVAVGIIFVFAFAIALVLALSLHEMSHALAAKINGDLTAAMYGRLSINPMRHFDPIGLVMMLLVGFGWAKPVPVDPRNFKNYRKGMLDVALSGVITNLIVAFVCSFFLALMGNWLFTGSSANFVYYLKYFLYYTFGYSVLLNINFALFNILPLFPLDGFRVIEAFSKRENGFLRFMRRYSWTILMGLILLGFVSERFFGVDVSPITLYISYVGRWITSALKWLWGLLGLYLPL